MTEAKKLMYKQHVGSAHIPYEVPHTSVTNTQIIPFIGPKTIKTMKSKEFFLKVCGWPISMTKIQALSSCFK